MIVDWSDAPEDCVGALVAKVGNSHFPKVTFVRLAIFEQGRVRGVSCEGVSLCAYLDMWAWEDRPWKGAGLPPVGTVCENQFCSRWKEVKIIAHDDERAVFRLNEGDQESYFGGSIGEFRPIRTPEQIAAEERTAAIKEMVSACHYSGSECTVTDCTALYDAGYRKQAHQ